MEYIDEILEESLNRYFSVLEKTGYINISTVDLLILLSFLQEFIIDYLDYITELDYEVINKIVGCISDKSCLVPYRIYRESISPINGYIQEEYPRMTLNEYTRYSLGDEMRLVNL